LRGPFPPLSSLGGPAAGAAFAAQAESQSPPRPPAGPSGWRTCYGLASAATPQPARHKANLGANPEGCISAASAFRANVGHESSECTVESFGHRVWWISSGVERISGGFRRRRCRRRPTLLGRGTCGRLEPHKLLPASDDALLPWPVLVPLQQPRWHNHLGADWQGLLAFRSVR
jgi:hypothetical protein